MYSSASEPSSAPLIAGGIMFDYCRRWVPRNLKTMGDSGHTHEIELVNYSTDDNNNKMSLWSIDQLCVVKGIMKNDITVSPFPSYLSKSKNAIDDENIRKMYERFVEFSKKVKGITNSDATQDDDDETPDSDNKESNKSEKITRGYYLVHNTRKKTLVDVIDVFDKLDKVILNPPKSPPPEKKVIIITKNEFSVKEHGKIKDKFKAALREAPDRERTAVTDKIGENYDILIEYTKNGITYYLLKKIGGDTNSNRVYNMHLVKYPNDVTDNKPLSNVPDDEPEELLGILSMAADDEKDDVISSFLDDMANDKSLDDINKVCDLFKDIEGIEKRIAESVTELPDNLSKLQSLISDQLDFSVPVLAGGGAPPLVGGLTLKGAGMINRHLELKFPDPIRNSVVVGKAKAAAEAEGAEGADDGVAAERPTKAARVAPAVQETVFDGVDDDETAKLVQEKANDDIDKLRQIFVNPSSINSYDLKEKGKDYGCSFMSTETADVIQNTISIMLRDVGLRDVGSSVGVRSPSIINLNTLKMKPEDHYKDYDIAITKLEELISKDQCRLIKVDCLATSKNPILLFKVIAGENVANWKSDKPIFVLTEEKMGQKKLESSETLKYSFVRKDNDKKCHVSTPKWDKKDWENAMKKIAESKEVVLTPFYILILKDDVRLLIGTTVKNSDKVPHGINELGAVLTMEITKKPESEKEHSYIDNLVKIASDEGGQREWTEVVDLLLPRGAANSDDAVKEAKRILRTEEKRKELQNSLTYTKLDIDGEFEDNVLKFKEGVLEFDDTTGNTGYPFNQILINAFQKKYTKYFIQTRKKIDKYLLKKTEKREEPDESDFELLRYYKLQLNQEKAEKKVFDREYIFRYITELIAAKNIEDIKNVNTKFKLSINEDDLHKIKQRFYNDVIKIVQNKKPKKDEDKVLEVMKKAMENGLRISPKKMFPYLSPYLLDQERFFTIDHPIIDYYKDLIKESPKAPAAAPAPAFNKEFVKAKTIYDYLKIVLYNNIEIINRLLKNTNASKFYNAYSEYTSADSNDAKKMDKKRKEMVGIAKLIMNNFVKP